VVSEQEREDEKAGFESAKAKVSAALSQVNLAEAEVERLAADERFKQVRAPFTGTIVQRRIDVGNLVTAGSTAGNTPLYRMTRNDPIRVFVEAPQAVSESMKVGTPVQIHVNAVQNRPFGGRITRTARAVDTHARTLRVEIDIPNHDDVLLPGLYVKVGFHLDRVGTAQVPAAALVARAAGPQVAVVAGDDTVQFRDVSIARDDGKTVDLASGVAPGDRVVLNISSQIAAGQKVRPSAEGSHLAGAVPAAPALPMMRLKPSAAATASCWPAAPSGPTTASLIDVPQNFTSPSAVGSVAAEVEPPLATASAPQSISQMVEGPQRSPTDSLVSRAIEANLDLGIALTRVQEARTRWQAVGQHCHP
jgi:RND family efflux transporter MFP subunit